MYSAGVHAVRVLENEWHLLGSDSDGPDGSAVSNELRGDHRVHQVLPARLWRHQRQHRP